MKYLILCLFFGVVTARPQDAAAAPPAASPPAAAAAAPAPSGNVSFVKNDVKPLDSQGNYQYDIELSDGTKLVQMGHTQAPEAGSTDSVLVVQGSYSYVSPDGKTISITYTADDKGFVAMGDAIPQAPTVPGASSPPPAAAGAAAPAPAADAAASAAPPPAAAAPGAPAPVAA